VGVSRDCPNFLNTASHIGTGKGTNFKFGRYVRRVHLNKSPLKILEKKERGRIQGLPKFFEYPLLSQERVKLRTSNSLRTFLVAYRSEQKPIKSFGKSNRGRSQGCTGFAFGKSGRSRMGFAANPAGVGAGAGFHHIINRQ